MIRNITRHFVSQQKNFISLRNKATATNLNEKDLEDLSLTSDEVVEEDNQARMEEIELKRNKSRLQVQHRNLLHNSVPFPESVLDFQRTVKYQRKLYGKYGEQSGVNPGICWPTKAEIEEIREYEKIAYPYTVKEMMAQAAEKRKEAEEVQRKRQEDIVKKHAKLEQWKKELTEKIHKKEYEARAAKERKDRLVEEVRRHFGFKIDPRDERFKEMLEQKERAEKKAMKEAKRKVKEARLIAKLQEKKSETNAEVPSEKAESQKQES